jgi:DNA-directed RNA polymerase subunit L
MEARINNIIEEDSKLTFTLSNLDVSFANAIRRTILSDIPIVGFKTSPYEENKCNIYINTSKLDNEIIKQRLSCIPICINDLNMPINNYLLELDVENKTDTMVIVTTKDFKIRDVTTNDLLEENIVQKIFPAYIPPDGNGEYYIDFVKLRPRLSDQISGERIKLTCEFSIVTAKEDSMFNITGTCSYGQTPDVEKMEEELQIRKQTWKDEGKTKEEVKFEADNWKLLDGLRYVKVKSFDFIIQSVGIYENIDICTKACDILISKFENLNSSIDKDELEISASNNTLDNCYDVILKNEDYTIGNILNYQLYTIFYVDLKLIDYIGFKKVHPHDSDSIIRLSVIDKTKGISNVKVILKASIDDALKKIQSIKGCFTGKRSK